MDLTELMILGTFVSSLITMAVVCIALLPQMRDGLVLMRDAVLWSALVVVIFALAWIGWHQWNEEVPGSAQHVVSESPEPLPTR